MGDSQHPLGPRLGRIHAWRDRGSIYVDGIRTSAQAGILTAGVAKGAAFTDTTWAVALGIGFFLMLEGAKVLAGWADYHFKIVNEHQRVVATANPIGMRQLHAIEELVAQKRREE